MAIGLKALRNPVYRIIEPVTRWLIRRGVHPNAITTAGFVSTVVAGYLFHLDRVRWAGFLILLGGLFDIFDGRVARESGLASKFGSFYDSTLDRMSEIVVYLGLLSLYTTYNPDPSDLWMVYMIALAMAGSLMVSYTRARAEALGMDCSVGLMQRAERVVLLGLGALLFGLMWDGLVIMAIIIILAVMTNMTAIQRIVWVYQRGAGVPLEEESSQDDAAPEREDAGADVGGGRAEWRK